MALAKQYYSSYKSNNNIDYYCEIWVEDFSGNASEISLGEGGPLIKYDTDSEHRFSSIISSSLELPFVVKGTGTQFFITQLRTVLKERQVYIHLYRATSSTYSSVKPLWSGFLIMDLGAGEDVFFPYEQKLTFVDGLSLLKDIDFVDLSSTLVPPSGPALNLRTQGNYLAENMYYGPATYIFWIREILKKTGASLEDTTGVSKDYGFTTAVNWYNGSMANTNQSSDPLALTKCNVSMFHSKDDQDVYNPLNCYLVLKELLRHWGARITYWKGEFWIVQIPEYITNETGLLDNPDNINSRQYSFTGAFLGSQDHLGSTYYTRYEQNLTDGQISKLTGTKYNYLPMIKEVEADYLSLSGTNYYGGFPYGNSNPLATTLELFQGRIIDPSTANYLFISIPLDWIWNMGSSTLTSGHSEGWWCSVKFNCYAVRENTDGSLTTFYLQQNQGDYYWIDKSNWNPLGNASPKYIIKSKSLIETNYIGFQEKISFVDDSGNNIEMLGDWNFYLDIEDYGTNQNNPGSFFCRFSGYASNVNVIKRNPTSVNPSLPVNGSNTNSGTVSWSNSLEAVGMVVASSSSPNIPNFNAGTSQPDSILITTSPFKGFLQAATTTSIANVGVSTNTQVTNGVSNSEIFSFGTLLWGDAVEAYALGSLKVKNASNNFVQTDPDGEWGRGVLTGELTFTNMLINEFLTGQVDVIITPSMRLTVGDANKNQTGSGGGGSVTRPRYINPIGKLREFRDGTTDPIYFFKRGVFYTLLDEWDYEGYQILRDPVTSTTLNNNVGGNGGAQTNDPIASAKIINPTSDALMFNSPIASVSNSVASIGSNVAVNGNFNVAVGWSLGAGWSINTTTKRATFIATGSVSVLSQGVLTQGKPFQINFTINLSAGSLLVKAGTAGTSLNITSSGIYSIYLDCEGSNVIKFEASTTFTGDITGIHIADQKSLTSLPINSLGKTVFKTGDTFNLINSNEGEPLVLTVSSNQGATDTAISVNSTLLYEDISINSTILINQDDLSAQYQNKTKGTVAGFDITSTGIAKSSINITDWLNSDTMTGAAVTNVPTALSVKNYVDNSHPAEDQTLQEVTDNGNTTTNSIMIGSSSSPSKTLHVYSATVNEVLKLESGDSGAFAMFTDNNSIGNNLIGVTGDNLLFWTNSTEKLRLTSGGDLLLGTSTNSLNSKLKIRLDNFDARVSKKGLEIDYNISGSQTLTTDITQTAARIDITSSATGGNLSNESRLIGAQVIATADGDGDPDNVKGIETFAKTNQTSNTIITNAYGIKSQAITLGNNGTLTSAYGGYLEAVVSGAGSTISNLYGIRAVARGTGLANTDSAYLYGGNFLTSQQGSGTIANADGVYGEVEISNGTITNARASQAIIDHNGGTITNSYQFYGSTSGTINNQNYGIYSIGADKNYLSSSVLIGSTTKTSGEMFKVQKIDTTPNQQVIAAHINYDVSGTDVTTADRSHIALRIDTDSSATGGDTNHEHRLYGIYLSQDLTGDSDLNLGIYNLITTKHSGGQVTNTKGVHNLVQLKSTGGASSNLYGTHNDLRISTDNVGNVSNIFGTNNTIALTNFDDTLSAGYGSFNKFDVTSGASTINNAHGVYAEVEIDSDSTILNAYGFRAIIDHNGGTINKATLFSGNAVGTIGSVWGLNLQNDNYNKLEGKLIIGFDTTTENSIKNTLSIYHDGVDGDNGVIIVRDNTVVLENDLLGAIGFDSTDGNVPSSALEASSYIAAYASETHSTNDKGGYLTFGITEVDGNDDIVSVERMRINNIGVGINTINPSEMLHVVGKGIFTDQVTIPAIPVANTDAASKSYVDAQVGASDTLQEVTDNGNSTNNNIILSGSSSTTISSVGINNTNNFDISSAGIISFTISSEKMRLDNSGKLLINATTSSFSDKFYINGDAYSTGAFRVGSSATFVGKIYNNSGKFTIESDSNRDIQFGDSNNNNILYIDTSTKKIGLGTITPQQKIHIVDTDGSNIILNSNTGAENNGVFMTEGAAASPYTNGAYAHYDSVANAFKINTGTSTLTTKFTILRDSGNILIGTTSDLGSMLNISQASTSNHITLERTGVLPGSGTIAATSTGISISNTSFAPKFFVGTDANTKNISYNQLTVKLVPVDTTDAVSKSYADGLTPGAGVFLPLTGGTLTGALTGTTATFSTLGFNSALVINNNDTNYSLIQYNYSGAVKGFSGYNSGFMIFGGESGVTTRLQSGGAYAATILTNGNFLINSTSDNGAKLQVTGSTRFTNTNSFPLQLNRGLAIDVHGTVGVSLGLGSYSTGTTYVDAARITANLESATSGDLFFQVNNGGTYSNALKINNDTNAIFSGSLTGTTATFSGQVTIPATPVANTDSASKGYVDAQVSATDSLQEVTNIGNTTTNSIMIGSSSSPSATLHVIGNAGATTTIEGSTQSTLNLKTTSPSKNNYIVGTTAGDLSFRPNGVTSTTLKANGNLLIGTTTDSGAKLNIEGGLAVKSGNLISFINTNLTYNSIKRNTSIGGLQIDTGGSASMNILDNGNVLIGTTADSGFKLNVDGIIAIPYNGSNSNYFRQGNSLGYGYIYPFDNTGSFCFDSYYNYGSGSNYKFKINTVEKMRLTAAGNLLVGGTNENAKLTVRADSGYAFRTENASGNTFRIESSSGNIYTTGDLYVQDNNKIRIGDSSDLQIYHSSSNNISFINNIAAGGLRIYSNELIIFASNGTTARAKFSTEVKLFYNDSNKFETTNTGANIYGNLLLGTTVDNNSKLNISQVSTSNHITLERTGVLPGSGTIAATSTGISISNTSFAPKFFVGTDANTKNISYNQLTVKLVPVDTTDAVSKSYADGLTPGAGVFLPLAGGTLTGSLTGTTAIFTQIELSDNQPIYLGTGGVMKIFNDGANSIVRSQGEPLNIDANGINFRGYSPYNNLMKINSNGNVLIGTTSDSGEKLQVAGDLKIKSNNPNLIIEDTNGRSVEIDVVGNDFRIDDVGNNAAILVTDLSQNPPTTTFYTRSTFFGQVTIPATPVASTDAASKSYVDAHGGGLGPFLPLTGGTLTGALTGTTATFSDQVEIRSGKKLILQRPNNAVATEISTDINGTMVLNSVNNEGFKLQNSGTTLLEIGNDGNNLILNSGLVTNGNVGIFNTNPTVAFEVGVNSTGNTKRVIFNGEGGNATNLILKSRTNRSTLILSDNDTTVYFVAEGGKSSWGFGSNIGSANNILIDNSGNVAIGSTITNSGAKLHITGNVRITGSFQVANTGGFLLADTGGSMRYGLKYGAAGAVGSSNLLMLTNRSLSSATGGGEVAISANASTSGVTETEVMRIKANTQSQVSIDGVLSLTSQNTPADPPNRASTIWLDSNYDLKIKITNNSGVTVTKTIAEYS